MPFLAFAESGYWRVNVLVAYDEEWQWTANYVYAYSAEDLAHIIIGEVNDQFYASFQIYFSMIAYTFWDSDDNPADYNEMFDEVVSETGFYKGMTIGSYTEIFLWLLQIKTSLAATVLRIEVLERFSLKKHTEMVWGKRLITSYSTDCRIYTAP